MRDKVLYLTRTAVLLAILVVVQAIAQPLGQLAIGSLVNLILLIAVLTVGLWSGLAIAAISPVLASFFNVGPPLVIVPFIMAANVIIVTVAHLIAGKHIGQKAGKSVLISITGLVAASTAKFLFLWVVLANIALPLLPIDQTMIPKFSVMFSWIQLLTALIGSTLAMVIVPVLKKVVK